MAAELLAGACADHQYSGAAAREAGQVAHVHGRIDQQRVQLDAGQLGGEARDARGLAVLLGCGAHAALPFSSSRSSSSASR